MRTKIILAVLPAVVALVCGCDRYYDSEYDERYYETSKDFMTLRNFSSDTTVWFIPERDNAATLPSELSEWQSISVYEIGPHSAMILTFDSNDSYVTPVETYGVEDRMVIYVFKKKVWESNDWSALVSGKMWCGCVSYSVDEIVALNKIVTYPMR